jgi:hypothetical protein
MNSEAMELTAKFADITRSRTLREIVDAITEAAQVGEDGELTPDACEALDRLNLTLERKVEAYHVVDQELTESAAGNKSLAVYYECRARMFNARAERLRARLKSELERLGETSVKTPTIKASVELNPAAVDIANGTRIDDVPADYIVVKRDIDKGKLLRAMKAGQQFTFASIKRGTHLRWR